jgi:hypothetical protein
MDFDLAPRRDQAMTSSNWAVYAVLALGFGLACWMLIYIASNAAQMRAAVESQRADEIKQENLEVCARLAMPPETEAFLACAAELTRIRQRHDERRDRDFYFH